MTSTLVNKLEMVYAACITQLIKITVTKLTSSVVEEGLSVGAGYPHHRLRWDQDGDTRL